MKPFLLHFPEPYASKSSHWEAEKNAKARRVSKMNTTTNLSSGNQPEKKFRAGVISATVWLNHGQSKNNEVTSFRTISLQRGYKDKENNWQNTSSMRVNDLPRATLVLTKAYEYLVTMQHDSETAQEEIVM
jgi:hypothetical protein